MPVGIAPTPSDAPVGQAKKGSASSVATIPFARASKWHLEISNQQSNIALGGAQQVFNLPIASYGYLSAILITVQLSGGAGGAGLTFFEDAPWSLFSQVQLSDVNGVPIVQLPGFSAYLQAKYGGYRLWPVDSVSKGATFDADTAQTLVGAGPASATTTGSNTAYFSSPSATTGNCKFILPIFLEFGLDGMGCLPNMDNSARYNLQLTVAGGAFTANAAGPYVATATTIPTTLPTMSITVEILARSQPPAVDMFGLQNSVSPPAVGTVQYWTQQTASGLANGSNTIQLSRVGNLIRNHILVFRDGTTNPARQSAEANWLPPVFEMDWDSGQRYVGNLSTLRYINGYGVYGLDMPNGVLVLPNTLDPDKIAVSEYGDEWLGSVGATKFTLRFTPAATPNNGSVSIITNDIVPSSSQVYEAPHLQTL